MGESISQLGAIFALLLGILSLLLPRRYSLIPIFIAAMYITVGQSIKIFDFNFSVMRLIISVGWLRILFSGTQYRKKLNKLDNIIIYWLFFHTMVFVLREGTYDALKYQMGFAYNAAGLYFFFRHYTNQIEDYKKMLEIFSILIIPLGVLFVVEYVTGRNLFAIFGGVPEQTFIRGGSLRCQGPFLHPILAGTFAATAFPLFFSMIWDRKSVKKAIFATISCLIIVIASASSGPIIAVIVSVIGLLAWKIKNNMRIALWGVVAVLIGLQLVMKAPVWYIVDRVGGLIGGTGWHRSNLIDKTIENFSSWWILGTNYENTAEWFAYKLFLKSEQADITNQYIAEGIEGGLITLLLFIAIIVFSYKVLGRSLYSNKNNVSDKKYMWCMGVSLAAHCASFLSVPYFDQIIIFWYWLLAVIAMCYQYGEGFNEDQKK